DLTCCRPSDQPSTPAHCPVISKSPVELRARFVLNGPFSWGKKIAASIRHLLNFLTPSAFSRCAGVMELLCEYLWRTVMESKQLQLWNAVSVAGFTVLAGILTGYVALLIGH